MEWDQPDQKACLQKNYITIDFALPLKIKKTNLPLSPFIKYSNWSTEGKATSSNTGVTRVKDSTQELVSGTEVTSNRFYDGPQRFRSPKGLASFSIASCITEMEVSNDRINVFAVGMEPKEDNTPNCTSPHSGWLIDGA